MDSLDEAKHTVYFFQSLEPSKGEADKGCLHCCDPDLKAPSQENISYLIPEKLQPKSDSSECNDPSSEIYDEIDKQLTEWETSGELTKEKLHSVLDHHQQILESTENNVNALLSKAYIYSLLGERTEYIECLAKAAQINPNDYSVRKHLLELGRISQNLDDDPELSLYFQDEQPTQAFIFVVTEIFQRFASKLTPPKHSLGVKELNEIHLITNDIPIPDESLEIFFSGTYELNDVGELTLDGFIEFYATQTLMCFDETKSDFEKLGYTSSTIEQITKELESQTQNQAKEGIEPGGNLIKADPQLNGN